MWMSSFDEDFKRMKLIELAQFVLNRKTENIRSELYEYLISNVIYHKGEKIGLTKMEIQSSMKEIYGLDVPLKLIEMGIGRLISKNEIIIPKKEPIYLLSEEKLKEIYSYNEEYKALREKIILEFLNRIRTVYDLSQSEVDKVSEIFFSIVSTIFSRYGNVCSGIIAGKEGEIKDITTFSDFREICMESVKTLENPILRKLVKDEFRNYFLNPTKEFIYFLYSMAQSYIIAQILNLDPELQTLERESFSKKKLYLDTNVIVSLMCVAQLHDTVSEIISFTRDLGIKMVYTPETRREFLRLLNYAKENYRKIPIHEKRVIQKVEPLMEDPFIRSFWMESKEKEITWDGYVMKMEGFQEYIKDKFSITLDTLQIKGIREDPEFHELIPAISMADFYKLEPAVEHDAFHILLIKKLREKEEIDELGMKYYFLTRDFTLNTAEHSMYSGGRIPSNVTIDCWFQMILPFLSPKIVIEEASDVYVKLLSSQFPSLTRSVDPIDLIDMMGIWMEDPDISTETLRKIIGNYYVRQHLMRLREIPEKEPSKISELVDPILKQVVSTTKREYKQEISKLKTDYDRKISNMKREMRKLELLLKKKKISKPLFVTGLGLFVALMISAFLASYLSLSLPDAFYYALGGAGTLFIASSAFGAIVFKKS